ncbi:MAG TPA: HAMP domain-containing sensor histidine kinase [Candidatus Saccharimonadales bacterium]|nr:HAMP domain-containing sensor histidine kinase [Candidatus Saccharimonadales bacterium]
MIGKLRSFIQAPAGRLTFSYLAIIMAMSIGFSWIFYNTSASELNRPGPGRPVMIQVLENGQPQAINEFLEERAEEGRRRLLGNLIAVNAIALLAGTYISYMLARKTLEPIEAAMEAQSRFTSDASHELRTPLTTIQTENEVALRKANLTLPRAKELLRSNLEEAGKLRILSEGLLQLARAEQTDIKLQPISLAAVATEAINRVIKPAQDKNIVIEDSVQDMQVNGDQQLLIQALVIVLDNAVKYSPAKTAIQLSAQSDGKYAVVSVTDQGPGISAIDQAHIFDRFYRADVSRTKQQVSGYGLGLSIADKIIRQHNGSIAVQSEPGKGSTFTIKLPLA